MFYNYFINKNKNGVSFETKNIDISILNGIRRTLIMDIPVLGFVRSGIDTSVDIIENNTVLNNEFLIDRIAAIPLNITEEYNDQFDPAINKIEASLNIECNTNENIKIITTNDLIVKIDDKIANNFFKKNNVTSDYIVITKLRKNEKLHFTATGEKFTGRKNALFSIVSGLSVYNKPKAYDVNLDILDNERNYIDNEYVFKFEIINTTFSHYYMLSKAIDIIINKLNTLNDNISIIPFHNNEFTYDFDIKDENDTIGNIIQSFVFDNYFKTNTQILGNNTCAFVGYVIKHPLDKILTIRITLNNKDNLVPDIKIYKEFMEIICNEIITKLEDIKQQMQTFFTTNM